MAKKLDAEKAKKLWDEGYSDEAIGRRLGTSPNAVFIWRKQHNLCKNNGLLLSKEEIRLPEVGWELKRVPHWMESESVVVPPQRARVIAVNKRHLFYTVEYLDIPGHPKESFRGI